jgi:hypothetical protein
VKGKFSNIKTLLYTRWTLSQRAVDLRACHDDYKHPHDDNDDLRAKNRS